MIRPQLRVQLRQPLKPRLFDIALPIAIRVFHIDESASERHKHATLPRLQPRHEEQLVRKSRRGLEFSISIAIL